MDTKDLRRRQASVSRYEFWIKDRCINVIYNLADGTGYFCISKYKEQHPTIELYLWYIYIVYIIHICKC